MVSAIGMKQRLRKEFSSIQDVFSLAIGQFTSADLSIFHEFDPPPTGGGHQFLRAFWREAESRGVRVENNIISRTTRACLMNSFNFNFERLKKLRRSSVLFTHRVDGPVGYYRGQDDGIDRRILEINQKVADRTVFQSRYSLKKHLDFGMEFREPVVIMNAADLKIFNPQGRLEFSKERKIRLIASSWSDNVNKGAAVYQWLDENLDWKQFEFTFVGRSPISFRNIRIVPPVASNGMADLFRIHDIYITASRNDPCSNSLIEALSCGLPAVYLKSGGHSEIVGEAGYGFESAEEIPTMLVSLLDEYELIQEKISVPSIYDVTSAYLDVLGL